MLIALFCHVAFTQTAVRNNIPLITNNADTLSSAWTGGINNPVWGQIELNGDQFPDVVIFDSHDNTFIPMLNLGGIKPRYVFAPEYYEAFKNCNCEFWARFKDYDHDGDIDIFCGNSQDRITLYKNTSTDGRAFFNLEQAELEARYYSNPPTSLLSSKVFLPDFEDIDEDGDLDFITWFLQGGGSTVEYYENDGLDSFGNADTMVLRSESNCWGHFSENSFSGTISLDDTTFCGIGDFNPRLNGCFEKSGKRLPGPTSGTPKHIGGTNLLLDMDGDKVKELMLGDIGVSSIFYLHNCGNLDYAYIDTAYANFPAYDTPIDLFQNPALTYMDFDNDGIRDLMVGTYESGEEYTENVDPVMWYQNIGADDAPVFSFRQRGVLSDNMADVGRYTKPCFMDVNADGLLDMIVGHGGTFDRSDSSFSQGLILYENIGTTQRPAFKITDTDFLNTMQAPYQLPSPTAGDIDKDGDMDLLIGQLNGEIAMYENTAGAGHPATFTLAARAYQGIDVGEAASPFLQDMDKDGDMDLLVGHKSGSITYFRNTTFTNTPVYTFITDKWGFFSIQDKFGRQGLGRYAVPFLVDVDGDQELELLTGSESGEIQIYEGVATALLDTLRFAGTLLDFDFGAYSAPAIATLDSTGDMSYIIGTARGGFMLANSLPYVDITVSPITSIDQEIKHDDWGVHIFPNPTSSTYTISHTALSEKLQVQVFDGMGKMITKQQTLLSGSQEFTLQDYPTGMYYIRVSDETHSEIFRIIKK